MITFTLLFENRVNFLKQYFYDSFRKAGMNTSRAGYEALWKATVDSDPTRKKIYLQWIINQITHKNISERLKFEDLYKVTERLEIFERRKNLLSPREKDINSYKTYRDFIETVEEKLENSRTGKEAKQEEWDNALKNSNIIYKGSEGMVVSPKTEKASCILGRGTEWCTAAAKSVNYFNSYNREGPLYIIITKDDRKFQIHFESGYEGFMDERDMFVDPDKFHSKYPWVFGKVFKESQLVSLIKKTYGNSFNLYPSKIITDKMIKAIISNKNDFDYLWSSLAEKDINPENYFEEIIKQHSIDDIVEFLEWEAIFKSQKMLKILVDYDLLSYPEFFSIGKFLYSASPDKVNKYLPLYIKIIDKKGKSTQVDFWSYISKNLGYFNSDQAIMVISPKTEQAILKFVPDNMKYLFNFKF
jgi:hypothetical protein